jgi:hypothetical protein
MVCTSVYARQVAEDLPLLSFRHFSLIIHGNGDGTTRIGGLRGEEYPTLFHYDVCPCEHCYILSSVISRNWAYMSREHSPLLLNMNL